MSHYRAIGCVLALTASALCAQSRKYSDELNDPAGDKSLDVIVRYKGKPAAANHDKVKGLGGKHNLTLDLINAAQYSVPGRAISKLANDPTVEFIQIDHEVSVTDFSGKMDYGWMTVTGLTSIDSNLAYDGSGVGVAIVDSGITASADLKTGYTSRLVYSQDFVNDRGSGYGHGTHVAGILGGDGSDSSGNGARYRVRGIAPGVKLISLKALRSDGTGTDSSVIAAIQRAVELKSTYNIRVLNLSLGRPVTASYEKDALCQAVEQAWKAGIVVVVAAGNQGRNNSAGTQGYGTITAPGNDPYVITVGAINTMGTASRADDKLTSYSSKGPTLFDHFAKPDLVAPGNQIVSIRFVGGTLDTTYPSNRVPPSAYCSYGCYNVDYFQLSGTSMAAPMVSGAAALLIQKNRNLTPDQVKAILMKTASKALPTSSTVTDAATGDSYTVYADMFTIGAGSLDVAAALASTTALPSGAALSPVVNYDTRKKIVTVTSSPNSIWTNSIVWGTSLVWGTNVVLSNSIVWGTTIVWGTSATDGINRLFSNSLIWGTNAGAANDTASAMENGEN